VKQQKGVGLHPSLSIFYAPSGWGEMTDHQAAIAGKDCKNAFYTDPLAVWAQSPIASFQVKDPSPKRMLEKKKVRK